MTTILGIETNYGKPSIVMAGDTFYRFDDGGKKIQSKLVVHSDWVIGFAGNYDKKVARFLNYLKGNSNLNSLINFLYDTRTEMILENFDERSPLTSKTIDDIARILESDQDKLKPHELHFRQLALGEISLETDFDTLLRDIALQSEKVGKVDRVVQGIIKGR